MGGSLTSLAPSTPEGSPPPWSSLATLVGTKGRAVVPAAQRVIEVPDALAGLLPDGGLRRGSTLSVEASLPGGTALALALLATATRAGSWCAAIGLPELGLVAAHQLGVCLERFALVPRPGPDWAVVAAALLEGADLLLVHPPSRVSPAAARRLVARARERDAVLVVVGGGVAGGGMAGGGMTGGGRWPEATELRLRIVASSWAGLGQGAGHLGSREVEVAVTGRRAAVRERRCRLLLPGSDGRLAAVPDAAVPDLGIPEPGVADSRRRAG